MIKKSKNNSFLKRLLAVGCFVFLMMGTKQEMRACICAAPGNVTANAATGVTQTGFTANWSTPTTSCGAITDYYIDLSTDNFATSVTGYPTLIGSTGTNTALSGLICGTTYYYRVQGVTCGGNSASWSNVITVSTSACSPCAGTPTAGTTVASPTSFTACAGGTTNLNLTGVSTVTGLTYQWQSSPDNVTWSNVGGATASTYTATIAATTYYHCVITCSNSGLSANSSSVVVTVPPACSGTPTAGSAVASVRAGCASYTTALSVSGNSYCGVTYQWQSSPDNSTWTNMAGATSSTATGTVTANTYYRCVITCTASGQSASSGGAYCQFGAAANDICTSPIAAGVVTTSGFSGNGNNLCATLSTGGITDPTPSCGARNRTLWYTFTTPAYSANYTITVVPSSMTKAGVAVYSGSCGSFTQVGCDYPGTTAGIAEVDLSCLTANTTYYIMVYDNGSAGEFFLNITSPVCDGGSAAATAVTKCTAGNYASTISLGNTDGCITNYQWQSSTNGTTWSNVAGATSATYAATISANIYYQCVVTCGGGSTSTSQPVYCSAPGTAPVNDVCTSALSMAFSPGINSGDYIAKIEGDNSCATADGTSQCFTANKTLWYKFTAPVAGSYNVMIESGGTMSYPCLSINTGACGSVTEVSCAGVKAGNQWESGNPPTYYPVNGYSPFSQVNQYYSESGICNVTAGQTVYVLVDDYSAAGTFTLTVATLGNDDIPQGVLVSNCGSVFNSSTIGATNCGNCSGTPLGGGEPSSEGIQNDFDCNLATVCTGSTGASCGSGGVASSVNNATYGIDGGDIGYSVENDSWYQFCVISSTTVTVNFQPIVSTCLPAASKGGSSALQISVFTGSQTNLTKVDGGFQGENITTSFVSTFAMSAGQCAFVEVDGFAGTNCDYQLALTMNPGCPLPVDIISFKGVLQPDLTTKLDWVVGSELNVDHYLIEKSSDNLKTFTRVGKQPAKGNSPSLLSYGMYDENPGKGYLYYKLSVVDKDGAENFLGYATVSNRAGMSHFNLFPNPAQNSIVLGLSNFSDPTATYELYNAQGTLVRTETVDLVNGGTEHTVDLGGLSKGIYFVRLNGTEEILSKTFIKSE